MPTRHLFATLCLVLTSLTTWGQDFFLGYSTPYFVQPGLRLGVSFPVLEKEKGNSKLALSAIPQLTYFMQPAVRQNVMLGGRLQCERLGKKRFSPYIALGLNYLFTSQRKDGSVNLGTGEIEFNAEQVHHVVPALSLGAKLQPKKRWGYYAEAFFGRSYAAGAENAGFWGAELGVLMTLTKKEETE